MNVGFKWRGHGLNGFGVFSTAEGLGLVNADLKILESQLHSGGVILCHFAFFFLFFKYIAEMKLDTASDLNVLVSQCPSICTM